MVKKENPGPIQSHDKPSRTVCSFHIHDPLALIEHGLNCICMIIVHLQVFIHQKNKLKVIFYTIN